MSYLQSIQKNIEHEWNDLVKSKYNLLIATVITKNISHKWQFSCRNKIIKKLIPPEVKILTLEFDLDYQKKIIKEFNQSEDKLTIHGSMISELQNILPENTLCLLVDIDAYPLSQEAIKLSFLMAKEKGIYGNIQRTNCIKNGENLFIGCSYMCFDNKKIKSQSEKNWIINKRSDCGEEISWIFPELIDEELFRPIKTIFKPIWPLEGNKPVYGIGTTFGINNKPMTYHHFFSRNEISRFHFFLVSFCHLLKISTNFKNTKYKKLIRNLYKNIIYEIKFSIKYLINKIN